MENPIKMINIHNHQQTYQNLQITQQENFIQMLIQEINGLHITTIRSDPEQPIFFESILIELVEQW